MKEKTKQSINDLSNSNLTEESGDEGVSAYLSCNKKQRQTPCRTKRLVLEAPQQQTQRPEVQPPQTEYDEVVEEKRNSSHHPQKF